MTGRREQARDIGATVRLGLRLTVNGGRESWARLALSGLGVALAVGLLLLGLTAQAAIEGRVKRSQWQHADASTPVDAPDAALFLAVTDYHDGQVLLRSYVAALGPHPPVPPGLERLPGPGEVAVSPALRRLLKSTPEDQLDDRYPGLIVATIGDAGLVHPDQAVAVIGRTPEQMSIVGRVEEVRGFDAVPSDYAYDALLRVFLAIAVGVLLVPVIILAVMATRVAAARRERRFAAIRLAGATRLQVAILAAVETGLAAAIGTAAGWLVYQVGRRVIAATVTYEGGRFFVDDVVVRPPLLIPVLVGMPLLAALVTVLSLRRMQMSPLGTVRKSQQAPLSPWRGLPIAVGVVGLILAGPLGGWPFGADRAGQLAPAFLLAIVIGVVTVGPWLCMVIGRALAEVARTATGLIAARRIAADPRATFRGVSGIVLGTFAAVFLGSAMQDLEAAPPPRLKPGVVEVFVGVVPEEHVAPLLTHDTAVARIRGTPSSCADLSRVLLTPCDTRLGVTLGPDTPGLPVQALYIPTDGTAAEENRVRTRAATVFPRAIIKTDQDEGLFARRFLDGVQTVVQLGALFVVLVAGCGLAVGTVGGLIERRRPFALLRAAGVRLGELRRVVLLETVVPMVVTAAVGLGLGTFAAWALGQVEGAPPLALPSPGLLAIAGGCIVVAAAVSTFTLPLLGSLTRQQVIRYE